MNMLNRNFFLLFTPMTLKNIPLEAYESVANGKLAFGWTTETTRYPLELFLRVMIVSPETIKILGSGFIL